MEPTFARIQAVYVISVAAELAGMHPQTLRMYEQKGLLNPARTQGGSRRYSDIDIDRLRRIQDLTAQGINLEGVRRIIELETVLEKTQEQIEQLRQEMHQALRAAEKQFRRDLVPFTSQAVAIFQPRKRS